MKQFEIKHIELKAANAFVAEHHRHHGPVTGHRFSLGCIRREDQALCGVAIVGRPLGYQRIITYILDDEPGTSLRAAGWTFGYRTAGGAWNSAGRPRKVSAHEGPKKMYGADLNHE